MEGRGNIMIMGAMIDTKEITITKARSQMAGAVAQGIMIIALSIDFNRTTAISIARMETEAIIALIIDIIIVL